MRKLSFILSLGLVVSLLLGLFNLEARAEELSALAKAEEYGLYQVAAIYTTYYDSSVAGRTRNIKLGASKLDATLLEPEEVVSFNRIVGPRTKARGFRKAPEIVNGELVDGVGGGLCQVASTLYNAVLLSDLSVVERHPHSRPVSYVDLGRGAAVYYDQLDFKFKNNRSTPIVVMARSIQGRITVSILADKVGPKVEISTDVKILEPEVKKKSSSSLALGEKKVVEAGRKGYEVKVTKIVESESRVIQREVISKDIYRPEERIIKVYADD